MRLTYAHSFSWCAYSLIEVLAVGKGPDKNFGGSGVVRSVSTAGIGVPNHPGSNRHGFELVNTLSV